MIKEIVYILKAFGIILLIGIVFFLIVTEGKGTYKLSGALGYSETIEESKLRGVFVCEYKCIFIPDSIKLADGVRFFLERGFRYGEWSADETDSLNKNDNFKYQLGIEFLNEEKDLFAGEYNLESNDESYYLEIPDTIYSDIITLSPPYDSIYKIGEMKLYRANYQK